MKTIYANTPQNLSKCRTFLCHYSFDLRRVTPLCTDRQRWGRATPTLLLRHRQCLLCQWCQWASDTVQAQFVEDSVYEEEIESLNGTWTARLLPCSVRALDAIAFWWAWTKSLAARLLRCDSPGEFFEELRAGQCKAAIQFFYLTMECLKRNAFWSILGTWKSVVRASPLCLLKTCKNSSSLLWGSLTLSIKAVNSLEITQKTSSIMFVARENDIPTAYRVEGAIVLSGNISANLEQIWGWDLGPLLKINVWKGKTLLLFDLPQHVIVDGPAQVFCHQPFGKAFFVNSSGFYENLVFKTKDIF